MIIIFLNICSALLAQAEERSLYEMIQPEISYYSNHMKRRFDFYQENAVDYLGEHKEENNSSVNLADPPSPAKKPIADSRNLAQSNEGAKINYDYPVRHRIVFDAEKMGKCMADITIKDFPQFKFSKTEMSCTWNIEGKQYIYTRADKPSFLDYLAGKARKCDYTSGQEEALREWVKSQEDNSIDPISIYRKALELNKGNVWNALLCVHQVLRQEARFFDTKRYNFLSTAENSRIFFNKFVDIRGDLRERAQGLTGDHAGSWYRMWGAMLFRLLPMGQDDLLASLNAEEAFCVDRQENKALSSLSSFANALTAKMVFFGDEVILKMHIEDDKLGKYTIDKKSAESMESLASALRRGALGKAIFNRETNCQASSYLRAARGYLRAARN